MDHLGRDSDEDQDGLLAAGVDLINEIAATSKLDSVWNKRTLSALTSTGTADFYILLSTLTVHLKKERYKRTKQTSVNMSGSSTSPRYRNQERLLFLEESDTQKVVDVIKFFTSIAADANQLKPLSEEWKLVLRKLIDRTERVNTNVKTASVRGNTAIQLAAFLGIIHKSALTVAFL